MRILQTLRRWEDLYNMLKITKVMGMTLNTQIIRLTDAYVQ